MSSDFLLCLCPVHDLHIDPVTMHLAPKVHDIYHGFNKQLVTDNLETRQTTIAIHLLVLKPIQNHVLFTSIKVSP